MNESPKQNDPCPADNAIFGDKRSHCLAEETTRWMLHIYPADSPRGKQLRANDWYAKKIWEIMLKEQYE